MRRHFAKKDAQTPGPSLNLGRINKKKNNRRKRLDDSDVERSLEVQVLPGNGPNAQEPSRDGVGPEPELESSFLAQIRQNKNQEKQVAVSVPKENPYKATPIVSRGFNFNEPGKLVKIARRDRFEKTLSRDQDSYLIKQSPPETEWWDVNVEVSQFVQHPVELEASWERFMPKDSPLYLTKEEQRRKRKKERELRFTEARERVKQGIDPPPRAKLKQSNVLAVIGSDYLRDPTKYDHLAREAEISRQDAHNEANESRKKTSDEKWEKRAAKIELHKSQGIYSAVYRIENLSDNKQRFLIDYTAKQMLFTGACISTTSFTLVVVEGGEKEIRKFDKLLSTRINWTKACDDKDLSSNRCTLVWHGQIYEPRYKKWSIHQLENDEQAMKFLAIHGSDSYWTTASSI